MTHVWPAAASYLGDQNGRYLAHGLVYALVWTVFMFNLEYMHFYWQCVQQKQWQYTEYCFKEVMVCSPSRRNTKRRASKNSLHSRKGIQLFIYTYFWHIPFLCGMTFLQNKWVWQLPVPEHFKYIIKFS